MKVNPRFNTLKGCIIILLLGGNCGPQAQPALEHGHTVQDLAGANPFATVGAIPPPPGFHRIGTEQDPFAAWLRQIPLKKDRTVHLFDGSLKQNQGAQYAVLDISVGTKDLQQCADAVMRLRAEYLYSVKTGRSHLNIDFYTQQGVRLNFNEWENGRRFRLTGQRLEGYTLPGDNHYCDSRPCFDAYLEMVFSYCGTLSLERQLVPQTRFDQMRPGDVLIKGGSPGHAMMVVDMAEDAAGQLVYLLAQSYMPAQDIHIVQNPVEKGLSPWYRAGKTLQVIETPEWTFYPKQLRTWPKMTGWL